MQAKGRAEFKKALPLPMTRCSGLLGCGILAPTPRANAPVLRKVRECEPCWRSENATRTEVANHTDNGAGRDATTYFSGDYSVPIFTANNDTTTRAKRHQESRGIVSQRILWTALEAKTLASTASLPTQRRRAADSNGASCR